LPAWGIAVIVCGALVLIFLLTMIAVLVRHFFKLKEYFYFSRP
jgi:hypothetical protein